MELKENNKSKNFLVNKYDSLKVLVMKEYNKHFITKMYFSQCVHAIEYKEHLTLFKIDSENIDEDESKKTLVYFTVNTEKEVKPVAYAEYSICKAGNQNYLYLKFLEVKTNFQNNGIGSYVLKEVEKKAKSKNCSTVILESLIDFGDEYQMDGVNDGKNEEPNFVDKNKYFYLKNGYSVVNSETYKINGRFNDVIPMKKKLSKINKEFIVSENFRSMNIIK